MNIRDSTFMESPMSAPREIKPASVRAIRANKGTVRTSSKKQIRNRIGQFAAEIMPQAKKPRQDSWPLLIGDTQVASNIELRSVQTIHPNPRNVRIHPKEQIKQLSRSIKQSGVFVPV